MKKRILVIMLMLCMLFSTTANARMNITGDSLPQGWTTDLSDNAQISVNDGTIRTEYTAEASTGRADVTSEPFAVNDSRGFYVDCTFNISGVDNGTYRVMQLTDGTVNTNLISIKDTQLTAFGETMEISENTDIKTELWIDTIQGRAILKINDNLVFSGINDDLNSAMSNLNKTALSIKFRNYRFLKGTVTAVSELSDVEIDTIGEYELTSNVEDGGAFKAGSETDLSLDFGIPVSDEISQKSNILLELNDAGIDFDALYNGKNLIITPQNNFSDLGKYKVIISEVKNIFGDVEAENVEMTFTVIDSSYIKPEITAKASKTYAKVGETVEISAEAVTSQTESVKIFVNGECIKEGTENQLTYMLSENEGRYEIYAEVTDIMGITAKSDKLTVTFEVNAVPEITLTDFAEVYRGIEGEEIKILAFDKDGIEKIKIYLNDVLYCEENTFEKTVSVAGLPYGKYVLQITAYDTTGLAGTKEVEFSVEGCQQELLYSEDFSDYTTSEQITTLKSGVLLAGQRGYVKPDVIDEAYGTSLIVGMDTVNSGFNDGDRPYVGIDMRSCTSKNILVFDMYISESPDRTYPGSITLKQSGGAESEIASVWGKAFHFAGADVPFETNKWYTFTIEVNAAAHKCSISITDGQETKTVSDLGYSTALNTCHYVRVGGPTSDTVKMFYALDNIRVYRESNFPIIARVGYDGATEVELISCNAETIDIYLSSSIGTIIKEQVVISDNGAPIGIENVAYNSDKSCITVTPKNKLRSNTLYKIILLKGIKMTDGTEIDRDTESSFITELEGTDIIDASYSNGNVRFTVKNNTADKDKLYAVAAVYNGDKFVRSAYSSVSVEANSNTDVTINVGQMSSGETAELYLWRISNGIIQMESSKIYYLK